MCLVSLQSTTINKPLIVLGYIDRLQPAIILLEACEREITLLDDELPEHIEAGMWVDVEIFADTYQVLRINDEKSERANRKATHLQDRLRNK